MDLELIAELQKQIQLSEDVKAKIIEEGLTMESFVLLKDDDMKELGFKMGARKLLLQWVERLKGRSESSILSTPAAATMITSPVSSSTASIPEGVIESGQSIAESLEQTLIKYVKPKLAVNGQELVAKLKAGRYYSSSERIFLVKVLGRRLMKTCAIPDRPSRDEKLTLAKAIIETFPVLRDASTPNGYETLYDPKAHTGYLEVYIRNRRSRDPDITTAWTHKRRSVVEVTTSENDERTLRELKPSSGNSDDLLKLMDQTRTTRRNWITDDHPTMTTILKRYPRFQDMNSAIHAEFQAVIPQEARNMKLHVQWRQLRDKILETARAKDQGRGYLHDLLTSIQDSYDEDAITTVSFLVLPHLLPVPPQRGKKQPRLDMKTVEEMFFFQAKEDAAVETVVKSLPTAQPVLFRSEGRLWIKADNSAIEITNAACFADAVELLLATFYVFNVDYPYHVKPLYEILETMMKLRKAPSSSVARELLRVIQQ